MHRGSYKPVCVCGEVFLPAWATSLERFGSPSRRMPIRTTVSPFPMTTSSGRWSASALWTSCLSAPSRRGLARLSGLAGQLRGRCVCPGVGCRCPAGAVVGPPTARNRRHRAAGGRQRFEPAEVASRNPAHSLRRGLAADVGVHPALMVATSFRNRVSLAASRKTRRTLPSASGTERPDDPTVRLGRSGGYRGSRHIVGLPSAQWLAGTRRSN